MVNEELRIFVHDKLLELLKFTDSVCKQENIPYSLIDGTLLGAVRHDGFIPWDDDADIVMSRADFNRFAAVIDKYMRNTPYVIRRNDRVDSVAFAMGQSFGDLTIAHLCVDIFIIDNVPDDDKAYKKQIFGLKKLQGMMKKGKVNWKRYNLKGKILVLGTKILGMFKSQKRILEEYSKLSQKYNGSATKRKFISNEVYSAFDVAYDNELLEEIIEHKFEDTVFPIFSHYDEILTIAYGDYMTPPPIEEQRFLHTYTESKV